MSDEEATAKKPLNRLPVSPRVQRWLIGLVVAYALYAIGLGMVAPRVAREPIENLVGELLGVEVSIERFSINPFTLRFEMAGIEAREIEGGLLLSAKTLVANIELVKSGAGVVRVAHISLDTPEVFVELSPEGDLNLIALLPNEDEEEDEGEEDGGLFPLRIDEIRVASGAIRLVDRSQDHLFITSIEPVDLTIDSISTVQGETARVRLDATSTRGIALSTEFEATLEPIAAHGNLDIVGVKYNLIADYLGPDFPVRPTSGEIDVHTDFSIALPESGLVVDIEQGGIDARDWEADSDLAELARFGLSHFSIAGFKLELADRTLSIDEIVLDRPHVDAVLPGPDGQTEIEMETAADEASAPTITSAEELPPGSPTPIAERDWQLTVARFVIDRGRVSIADRETRTTPMIEIGPIDFEALGISSAPDTEIDITLHVDLPDNADGAKDSPANESATERKTRAELALTGSVTARPPSAALDVQIKRMALVPWSPLIAFAKGTRIQSGWLDVTSKVEAAIDESTLALSASAHTDLVARDFALAHRSDGKTETVVAMKRLHVDRLRVTEAGQTIGIAGIRIDRPHILAVRDARGELNLAQLMAPPSAPDNSPAGSGLNPTFDLRRVAVDGGSIEYRDASTTRRFVIDLTDIKGNAERKALKGGGHIDFSARAQGTAPVRVTGEFPSPGKMVLNLDLEGLAVTALAPYFEQYVGSSVEQGKLHLDLDYEVNDRKVSGQNKVRFDRLSFGPRTGSPDAIKLPVPLAFKLMTDGKGQAAFDLPIKGDLDDPNFSLRGLVTAAFVKVIQQSLSSPLSILQTAMPDLTADKQTEIGFALGSAVLAPDQQDKLVQVATFLASKPKDRLAIKGRVDARRDRRALRDTGEKDVDDERLRKLGSQRARAVLTELVDRLGLDAGQIFVRSIDLDGKAVDDVVAVDVVLTDD